jgi:hypothetical protein
LAASDNAISVKQERSEENRPRTGLPHDPARETHVLFPVNVVVFIWGGLALRNPRLLSLLIGGK